MSQMPRSHSVTLTRRQVAYLSGLDNGACPDTHPVSLIHLFYEMTWDIHAFADRWNTSSGQWPFVWATGYVYFSSEPRTLLTGRSQRSDGLQPAR
jgi:hypothetical protein